MARPIAKDHEEKRAHILREAARVFANDGVARASMAQVAKACGISKANIYHYYGSKDALLLDILDSYLRALRDRLERLNGSEKTARDALRDFTVETLLAYEGMDAEHSIQTEGIAALGRAEQDVLNGYQRDMVSQLSMILLRCAPALGEDCKRLQATTMSVFGMLNWFYMWNRDVGRTARENYADVVTDLVLDGIA